MSWPIPEAIDDAGPEGPLFPALSSSHTCAEWTLDAAFEVGASAPAPRSKTFSPSTRISRPDPLKLNEDDYPSAACSAVASVSEAASPAMGGNGNATMPAGDASAQGRSETVSEAASLAVEGKGERNDARWKGVGGVFGGRKRFRRSWARGRRGGRGRASRARESTELYATARGSAVALDSAAWRERDPTHVHDRAYAFPAQRPVGRGGEPQRSNGWSLTDSSTRSRRSTTRNAATRSQRGAVSGWRSRRKARIGAGLHAHRLTPSGIEGRDRFRASVADDCRRAEPSRWSVYAGEGFRVLTTTRVPVLGPGRAVVRAELP